MANNLLVPNVYYTAQQYVDPVLFTTPQNALVDNKLIYPLLKDAGNYQVAVAKAEIPLDTIPLTRSNIPLKRYEVILRQGQNEASAYLRQLNASKGDFLWNCDPTGVVSSYNYTSSGTLTALATTDCSGFVPNGVAFFCVDDYRNAYFATASIPSGLVNTIIIVNLETNTQLASLTATLIQGMDLDRQNRLYVADEEVTGSVVKVYNNQNSATEVVLTLANTITTDYQGNPLTAIRTISADQSLLVGYDVNKFSIYNGTTFQPLTGFTNNSITHMGRASALNSAGQGSFVVVDDGEVDDLFIGCKTPASTPNLYNMVTDTTFGSPGITLDGLWLPTTKFAITDNGYCFGVGSNNQMYAFAYNSQTAQPTNQPFFVSASATFGSVTCEATRKTVVASSTGTGLYGLNLDNLPNNNFIEFDNQFKLNGVSPVSWDFQPSSHKYVGINSANNNLYITSKAIYPKNFMVFGSINPTSVQNAQTIYGFGWNTNGTICNSTQLQQTNLPTNIISVIDAYQDNVSNIIQLCSQYGGQAFITKTDINGNVLSSFNVNNAFYTSICHPAPNTVACMNNTTKNIEVYSTTSGALLSTITTGLGAGTAYICGGQGTGPGQRLIFVSCQTTLQVYQSSNGQTSWIQEFSSNSIIPTGATVPNWLYAGTYYGSGYTNSPTLYLVGSGSNTNPSAYTSQAVLQFTFDNAFQNITSVTMIQDNQKFTNSTKSLFYNYPLSELYMCQANSLSTQPSWNGNVSAWNVGAGQITSTIFINYPNINLNSPPILDVSVNGDSGYYTWNAITATGYAGYLISVACSRRNPNNLYVLNDNGQTYKGTLIGNNVAFSVTNAIATDTAWRSISLAPDAQAFDSFVYEYTLSNQTQVGTTAHYPGKLVKAVGRNDVAQNYAVSIQNTSVDFFNSTSFAKTGSASLNNANLIFTKAGEDVDAGAVDIYNFQVFLDALNGAFAEAYARLGGSLAEAPTATINFDNQLFTLNYSSDYTTQGNGIIFNPALLRIVQYYAIPDTTDVGFLKLVLPPNSTSWTQTNKSAYRFNKLNKILFQSTTIYVSGSFNGINAQNQTITDVDVPTDSFINNLGQTLYFQPNLLRPYQLGSNNPIDRVQLSILYSYLDGSEYVLTIAPDDGWSVLFDFIRKS